MPETRLAYYQKRHEDLLQKTIDAADIPAKQIKDAMAYALFPGGKRMRPMLVYLCGDLIGVKIEILDIIALSIELTHCYSLVHDDLPAMDNDDMRRGKASCHRAFDEATAILVGDGMQTFAIDLLLTGLSPLLPAKRVIAVTHALLIACGTSGMVSGQSLDLSELSNRSITESELCHIHQLKTGKLIMACVNMVLATGESSPTHASILRHFANTLGLVFQMQDDYLDRYNQDDSLGKGRSSDTANQKTTFATRYNQPTLFKLISDHFDELQATLRPLQDSANDLLAFTKRVQHRLWQHNSIIQVTPQVRDPERVFLREGSPCSGTVLNISIDINRPTQDSTH